jgi:hypothetical protein
MPIVAINGGRLIELHRDWVFYERSRVAGRPYAARAVKFLRDVLAGGPLHVPELDRLAREAGLLDERQHITHAKLFKVAKKSLGIRSSASPVASPVEPNRMSL